jgi:short-subunit dehydrogenase
VLVTKLDVLDLESIDNAIAAGIERFGKIDVVLNNAGYGLAGVFESTPRENMIRQFGVNVQGLFDVTQKVLPHFRKNKSGMFINISSVGGKVAFPFLSLYNSSKFAVEGFSEGLRWELEQIGIKVKLVEPGAVITDFGGRSMDMQYNPAMTEYNDFFQTFTKAFAQSQDPNNMVAADKAADVLFGVATDESDTFRYIIGPDAEQTLAARKAMNDKDFFKVLQTNFGF